MRLIHHIQRLLVLDDDPFVLELYRQLLNRAPDVEGFQAQLHALRFLSKPHLFFAFLDSSECQVLLVSSQITPDYHAFSEKQPRIIEKLRGLYQLNEGEFISRLYIEILARAPDAHGFNHHLHALRSGKHKYEIIKGFLKSPEGMALSVVSHYRHMQTKGVNLVIDPLLVPWWKGNS